MSCAPSSIVLASLFTVSIARAAPSAESVHVAYDAPPGCPTGEQFVAEVQARTARAAVTLDPDAAPLRIAVSIAVAEGAEGASSGRLQIRAEEGETVRTVAGDTCGEVVSALVLVAALAIDPNATTTASPPAAPESPPPPPPLREESAPPPRDAVRAPEESHESARTRRGSVGAGVATVGGIAPVVLVGASAAVGVALRLGPLSPVLRAGFAEASGGATGTPGPTASFTWSSATLDGCPHRFELSGVSLEPCVRFEAGAVNAAGSNVVPAREVTRAWLAAGAVGRAEWAVGGPVFVELEAGARVPLVRIHYVFEPDTEYYRTPVVAGFASAGIGVHFL